VPRFNGKYLTGWTPQIRGYDAGVNFGDTFRVADGVLEVAYETFDGRFGHLFDEAGIRADLLTQPAHPTTLASRARGVPPAC
jgi:hypothetical protein